MKKRIIVSVSVIALVAAAVIGGTYAFFSDTETSTGNVFTAGAIDLKVDHTKATYNGQDCVSECVETGSNLIANGGFETPDIAPGTWAIYPDASQTSWTVESGAGLEIQDHAAGDPHGGQQLGELDSNNSSSISQTLTTVPGAKYRLTFWYSPRPNRPAGDNTIDAVVKVVSDNTVLGSATVGAGSAGGGTTSWSVHTINFIAIDNSTKVMFSDAGTNNSYGGYLDDISVYQLNCTSSYLAGGSCTLWGEQDLGQGDVFWNFDDIKPGDHGTNVISLHVDSNDAYVCMLTDKVTDNENIRTQPEITAGDTTDIPGELSNYIKLFAWNDLDGDGVYEPTGETQLLAPNTAFSTEMLQLTLASAQSMNVGVAWCVGDQTVDGSGNFSCDGSDQNNDAQTDSTVADMVFYAVQQRNNAGFSCEDYFNSLE